MDKDCYESQKEDIITLLIEEGHNFRNCEKVEKKSQNNQISEKLRIKKNVEKTKAVSQ